MNKVTWDQLNDDQKAMLLASLRKNLIISPSHEANLEIAETLEAMRLLEVQHISADHSEFAVTEEGRMLANENAPLPSLDILRIYAQKGGDVPSSEVVKLLDALDAEKKRAEKAEAKLWRIWEIVKEPFPFDVMPRLKDALARITSITQIVTNQVTKDGGE